MAKSIPDENQSAKAENVCIAPENLSALIDGEYELTPKESEHLKHCKICSALLKSFQAVADAVGKTLDFECPERLSERLVLGVREKLGREERKKAADHRHFWSWATRIAAMLVLLGLIGYFAFKDGGVASGYKKASPEEVVVAPGGSNAEWRPAPPKYGIDITNTRLAATNAPSVKFSDAAVAQVEKVAKIEPKVRQLWIYDRKQKLADVERTLRNVIGKLSIPWSSVKMNVSPGSTELKAFFNINSYQTVLLARALKDAGYSLVSPVQPQPEQTHFIGTGREEIDYSLIFSPTAADRK